MAHHSVPASVQNGSSIYSLVPSPVQIMEMNRHFLTEFLSRVEEMTARQGILATALFLGTIYIAWSSFPTRQKYADAPIACVDPKNPQQTLKKARLRFRHDALSMLQEGYRQFKGRPWYVPSPLGERLMLPSRYVEEVKTAPMDEVDFVATFFEMFEGRYTTMGSRSTLHPRTARNELNHYMGMSKNISNHSRRCDLEKYLTLFFSTSIGSSHGRNQGRL